MICPHECGVDRTRGESGVCGASSDMVVSRAALHFWEEPPISGSSGSGTIFFSHCNLKCEYCQNAAISRGQVGKVKTAAEVAQMCLDLQAKGAMNVNFVTPTHYSIGVREAISLARESGLQIPVVWNTSGYESVDSIRENDGFVDVYLTDFKYSDADRSIAWSHVRDYPEVALRCLDEMVERAGAPVHDSFNGEERMVSGVIVRHLMLPGCIEDSKRIVRLLHDRYGSSIRLSLMNQYTPMIDAGSPLVARYSELGRKVSQDEYESLLDYADSLGVQDYFWQDGETALESFIPAFGEEGI